MFNPNPRVQVVPIGPGQACYVIDDALLEPDRLVAVAIEQRARFVEAGHNAYPGLELRMPDAFSAALDQFFRLRVRDLLGVRRVQRMYSRLSLVTRPPQALTPPQWLPHRDRMQKVPGECVSACVLYLFHDPALGGTRFYRPRQPERDTARLLYDSVVLSPADFAARYPVAAGYMGESNAFFEHALTIEPKWNRLIFYDGDVFHSGDIRAPERLSDDPAVGRLTLNGFFTGTRPIPA
ncbi:DUF6445 family protein [Cognatilysobacter tabacisoli]|uniref:DUF6445 family protein n=1 Tax=Cognatilysobacter tabacisoli TaxID=2315424 RepID=UPI000E6AF85B|nr:DUF6445 family protein [Lysobacter tabacisoli]